MCICEALIAWLVSATCITFPSLLNINNISLSTYDCLVLMLIFNLIEWLKYWNDGEYLLWWLKITFDVKQFIINCFWSIHLISELMLWIYVFELFLPRRVQEVYCMIFISNSYIIHHTNMGIFQRNGTLYQTSINLQKPFGIIIGIHKTDHRCGNGMSRNRFNLTNGTLSLIYS